MPCQAVYINLAPTLSSHLSGYLIFGFAKRKGLTLSETIRQEVQVMIAPLLARLGGHNEIDRNNVCALME